MGWIPVRRRYLPAAIRTRQPSADPEVVATVDAVVTAYMTAAEEVVDLSRVDDVLVPVVHSWTLLAGRDMDFLNRAREAERLLAAASAGPDAAGMTVGEPFWSSPPGERSSAPALQRCGAVAARAAWRISATPTARSRCGPSHSGERTP